MLILFSGGIAPDLPDLYIRDSKSEEDTPVAGFEGWDGDFIQVQGVCNAPMDFLDPETGMVAGDETDRYWCRRLSKALVRLNFSDSGATADIRILYYDKDDVEIVGEKVTVAALSRQDGTAYMAEVAVFDTMGANQVAVLVESVSTGTVDVSLAGV